MEDNSATGDAAGERVGAMADATSSAPILKRESIPADAASESPLKRRRVGEQPLTQLKLYTAATAMSDRMQQSLQALGATLMVGGTGFLAWHNWAVLAAYLTRNTLGGGALTTGLALVISANSSLGGSEKGRKAKFKLKLLNDEDRWKEDEKQMQELLGCQDWPSPELAKAAAEEMQAEKARVDKALADRAESVKAALASGEAASVIQARLRPRTFVFDFEVSDDLRQNSLKQQLDDLGDMINFILMCASANDSAVLRLKSPGGGVSDYGFAAAQLLRFRKQHVPLTVCIDNVAASGGYMMASTADKIVAAPFSFVGSIGVIAMLPNVSKVLKRAEVDFMQFTAGKYKRTVDPFTAPTDEGKAKMTEEIENIHLAFKNHVAQTRNVDIERVATGEAFLGVEALTHGLIDEIATSDEVLASRMQDSCVVEVSMTPPPEKGVMQMLLGAAETVADTAVSRVWGCLRQEARGSVALCSTDPKFRSS